MDLNVFRKGIKPRIVILSFKSKRKIEENIPKHMSYFEKVRNAMYVFVDKEDMLTLNYYFLVVPVIVQLQIVRL